MHQRKRSRPCPQGVSPAHDDRVVQSAVLLTLIDLHPVQVTASELVRQLAASPEDFSERDQVDRAVRELAGAGLLHRHDFLNRPDAIIAPTRAALFARELLTDDE